MKYSSFIGHDNAKLALILNAIYPRCGGVLFVGEKGCGKSTLARSLKNILPSDIPFVELPLNVTEDTLLGTIAIEDTLKKGVRVFQEGIFARANGGVLFIDDVNLLSPEIVSLILEVQGRGENIVEREGLTVRHLASFILVASMYPEEGELSPHLLDRFGMCVEFKRLNNTAKHIAVLREVMKQDRSDFDPELIKIIEEAQKIIQSVSIDEQLIEYIVDICLNYRVASHRADLYLLAAARAHAALNNRRDVLREDINVVAPLVIMHRQYKFQPTPLPQSQEEASHEYKQKPQEDNQLEKQLEPPQSKTDNHLNEQVSKLREIPSLKEEIFAVGQPFRLKRFIFFKDRIERDASGRRTRTRIRNRGGRYVKSMLRQTSDIAIDATLRAAAPLQSVRKRTNVVIINEEDFRYKRKERKMGHLVIFIVDGSGSMGAQKRMIAAKGAVQSLLIDCYQKRDTVAMIVFRKDCAKVVLEPTASVERAGHCLREIPVGGKTPLGAGLLEAYRLLERVSRKRPTTRFLIMLITDGRANQSVSDMPPREEAERIAMLLRERPGIDIVVVDTEEKGRVITTDLAVRIASILGADYYTIEDLKADYLIDLVKTKKTDI